MHWWHWNSMDWIWEGIALPNLAGCILVNAVALLLAAPALIDKRPMPPPPALLPLAVWFAVNTACLTGCLSRASEAAVAVLVVPTLVVTMLALQQHRRPVADCAGTPVRE
jgi:hypothetical protein